MNEVAENVRKELLASLTQHTEAAKKTMRELRVDGKQYLCVNTDKGMALANRGEDKIGLWPIDGELKNVRLMTKVEAERVSLQWNTNLTQEQFAHRLGVIPMYYMYALEALVERNEQMIRELEVKQ
jgi:hypothetical protein